MQIGEPLPIFLRERRDVRVRIMLSAAGLYFIFQFFPHKMSHDDIDNANLEQLEEIKAAHFVWKYFAVTNNIDAAMMLAFKFARKFCDKSHCGCSTSRVDSFFLL